MPVKHRNTTRSKIAKKRKEKRELTRNEANKILLLDDSRLLLGGLAEKGVSLLLLTGKLSLASLLVLLALGVHLLLEETLTLLLSLSLVNLDISVSACCKSWCFPE